LNGRTRVDKTVETELQIDREICVRRVQRTHKTVTRALATYRCRNFGPSGTVSSPPLYWSMCPQLV
jgi:hypothetical protein